MMQQKSSPVLILALALCAATASLSGCSNTSPGKAPATATSGSESGKIPITTSSEAARKEFMEGRDLAEKLLITDSLQHYDKAIALDPNFAMAELNRATSSPTAKEFFDHLKKAVSLADMANAC